MLPSIMKKEDILSEIKKQLEEFGILGKDFYIVCPCCGCQKENAPTLGVDIVANPNASEKRPFDLWENEKTFFKKVEEKQGSLTPAYELYQGGNGAYKIVHENHKTKAYFLSPAWGIVRSDFRLPKYNVSFSNNAKKKYRAVIRNNGRYENNEWQKGMENAFNHLKEDINKEGNQDIPIVLLMGNSYVRRFRFLYVFYEMKNPLHVFKHPKQDLQRTNWYYKYMREI